MRAPPPRPQGVSGLLVLPPTELGSALLLPGGCVGCSVGSGSPTLLQVSDSGTLKLKLSVGASNMECGAICFSTIGERLK